MAVKKLYNVRNILVNKDKSSDFLEFYQESLSNCPIIRILPSGPYYIYTLDNVSDNDRKIVKDNQDNWI